MRLLLWGGNSTVWEWYLKIAALEGPAMAFPQRQRTRGSTEEAGPSDSWPRSEKVQVSPVQS